MVLRFPILRPLEPAPDLVVHEGWAELRASINRRTVLMLKSK